MSESENLSATATESVAQMLQKTRFEKISALEAFMEFIKSFFGKIVIKPALLKVLSSTHERTASVLEKK